jgi:hypothetical protein
MKADTRKRKLSGLILTHARLVTLQQAAIGKGSARNSAKSIPSAVSIIEGKFSVSVTAELELSKIAVQVAFVARRR